MDAGAVLANTGDKEEGDDTDVVKLGKGTKFDENRLAEQTIELLEEAHGGACSKANTKR